MAEEDVSHDLGEVAGASVGLDTQPMTAEQIAGDGLEAISSDPRVQLHETANLGASGGNVDTRVASAVSGRKDSEPEPMRLGVKSGFNDFDARAKNVQAEAAQDLVISEYTQPPGQAIVDNRTDSPHADQVGSGGDSATPPDLLVGGYHNKYGDAELDQPIAPSGPPKPEVGVDSSKKVLSTDGRENIARMMEDGILKDKALAEAFYADVDSLAANGKFGDLSPRAREQYFKELDRRVAIDGSYEIPEGAQEPYKTWVAEKQASNLPEAPAAESGKTRLDELDAAFADGTIDLAGRRERLELINKQATEQRNQQELAQLREMEKSGTPMDTEQIDRLIQLEELERARETGEGEAEKPSIDKELEDAQVEILMSMSNGEISAEQYATQLDGLMEKFNKLNVVKGFENMGLSEEAARDIVQRAMSSELRGRLGQKNKEKIIKAREKIRELAAADLQLRSIKGRLEQAKDAQGKLLNLIKTKQRSYASYDNPNDTNAAAERMKLYGYMDRLSSVNEQVNRLKNASMVFVGDYRRTMADVRRSLGVTGLLEGFIEYSSSQLDQLEVNLMTNYRVVQATSGLNPTNR